MSNQLQEFFKDVPLRNVSPVSMAEANEIIKIYSGDFMLKREEKEFPVNGEIIFKWFPDMGVKFKASFTTSAKPNFDEIGEYEIWIDNRSMAKIKLYDLNLTEQSTCGGQANKFIWGEKSIAVNEVIFAIPNMREYLGDSVKEVTEGSIKVQKSRLILEDKPYKIILDKTVDYKVRQEKLNEDGGFLITYLGKITNVGRALSLTDLHKWHNRFHHFLYFLNGRRIAPMFYTGSFDGQNLWTDYTNYTVDIHKNVNCWSDIHYLNDLPSLWKSYNKLWKEENDQDFLKTAIHWYVEANSQAGMVDGSIILIQTALELIYNWLIVERQKVIIGGDAEKLSAANKIRMIIFQLKIDAAVPPAFQELAALPNVIDGPEAFTFIRNALVHGQESKRTELRKIDLMAKYQALQLGIWYVELALLFILDYKGKYRNRTDGNPWKNTGTIVPWINDKSFKIGEPSEFTEEQIASFVELLEEQGKVHNPSVEKVKRCKLIAMGFSWGKPVAIGAIKPKTATDFGADKANLPDLANDYDWEAGYFYTHPEHQGKGFSSMIFKHLLKLYGKQNLMATTEIRDGNSMINILQSEGFKQTGQAWESTLSDNELRLFLKDIKQEEQAILDSLNAYLPELVKELLEESSESANEQNDNPKEPKS